MGCHDKIDSTCGKRHNARCVKYEGELHSNTDLEECDCNSVHSVIEDINQELDSINQQIDLSDLGNSCIEYEKDSEGRVIVKEALKKIEECLCDLKDKVEDTDSEDCPNIFSQDISCLNLDFKCLTDPCGEQIQDLKGLLQALIDNTCEHTHTE